MEDVTRKLLEECSEGCRMAVGSINQVFPHVSDERLEQVMRGYKNKHEQIGKEADDLLKEEGVQGKAPGAAATAFSWITTEVKMKMNDDNSKISQLMMNGCNMGIQSISGAMHQYESASDESMKLARKLVSTEEAFMKELKEFL
ncbi:MAG: hypothetical protein Q4C61_17600 [Lachnospiraceae bacterium]|nr:hypothetical protein [Lachnospiraceae bacterium]